MKINNITQNKVSFRALYTNLNVAQKSQRKIVDLLAVNNTIIPNDLIGKLEKQHIDIFVNPTKSGSVCLEAVNESRTPLKDKKGHLLKTAIYSDSPGSIKVVKDFVKQCYSIVK